jgi:hypothetical protein
MLSDGKDGDIALVCSDGDLVLAHRLVLSTRCQYLGVLLMTIGEGGLEEENGENLNVQPPGLTNHIPSSTPRLEMEMNGATCRKILRYLYTDVLEDINVEEVPYVHEAASFLDIEFIRRKCEGADKLTEST